MTMVLNDPVSSEEPYFRTIPGPHRGMVKVIEHDKAFQLLQSNISGRSEFLIKSSVRVCAGNYFTVMPPSLLEHSEIRDLMECSLRILAKNMLLRLVKRMRISTISFTDGYCSDSDKTGYF
jgi:hypothetical protein